MILTRILAILPALIQGQQFFLSLGQSDPSHCESPEEYFDTTLLACSKCPENTVPSDDSK